MNEFLEVSFIGFISALMSSVSGAGTALFSTPLLLSLGVGLPAILSSNQFSSTVWTPIASLNYLKKSAQEWPIILGVTSFGLVGVLLGVSIIHLIPISLLKRIMGVAIILIVLLIALKKDLLKAEHDTRSFSFFLSLWGFPLGLYQSIFGAATIFSSIMFSKVYSLNLTQALSYSYAVAFPWCFCAAVLFYIKGWIIWSVALPFTFGSTCGAYLGSRLGSSLSAKTLRNLVLAFGSVMGLRFAIYG